MVAHVFPDLAQAAADRHRARFWLVAGRELVELQPSSVGEGGSEYRPRGVAGRLEISDHAPG